MARQLYVFYARDEAIDPYFAPGAEDIQRAWEESNVNGSGGLRLSSMTTASTGVPPELVAAMSATAPGVSGRYPDCVRITRLNEGLAGIRVTEIRAVALSPDVSPAAQAQWAQIVSNEFEMYLEDKLRTRGSELFRQMCDQTEAPGIIAPIVPGVDLICALGGERIGASFTGGVRYRLFEPNTDSPYSELLSGRFCQSQTREAFPGIFDKDENAVRHSEPEKNWLGVGLAVGGGVVAIGGLAYLVYKMSPPSRPWESYSGPSRPRTAAPAMQAPAPRPAHRPTSVAYAPSRTLGTRRG